MVVANVLYEKKRVFEIHLKCFWNVKWLDYKGCLLDKRFCCHPEGRCCFSSAGSLEEFCAAVTMRGRKYGLWRFFLLAWGVWEFTQKLSRGRNYCLSFRVVVLIAFHSWFMSIFVISFYRLPVGVRIYSYLQSLAHSCLPECELLF